MPTITTPTDEASVVMFPGSAENREDALYNPLAHERYKLNDVLLHWEEGTFKVVPKTAKRPEFDCGECDVFSLQEPSTWPKMRVQTEFLRLITLMMAYPRLNARAVLSELQKIDEFLEVIDRTHLAEQWTPRTLLRLKDVLFFWSLEDHKVLVVPKRGTARTPNHVDPCNWDQSKLAHAFLGELTSALSWGMDPMQVWEEFAKIEEFDQLERDAPKALGHEDE